MKAHLSSTCSSSVTAQLVQFVMMKKMKSQFWSGFQTPAGRVAFVSGTCQSALHSGTRKKVCAASNSSCWGMRTVAEVSPPSSVANAAFCAMTPDF